MGKEKRRVTANCETRMEEGEWRDRATRKITMPLDTPR